MGDSLGEEAERWETDGQRGREKLENGEKKRGENFFMFVNEELFFKNFYIIAFGD